MPKRETAPIGAPCWIELNTSDPDRARAFYTQLFGWEAEEPSEEFGGYFNFTKGGVRVAGGMKKQMEGIPDLWFTYLCTDDAEKTVAAATAEGGQTHVPPMPVADLGTMAVVADAGGAGVGIWQPGTHQGFGLVTEHGAPSWFELLTRDYDKAVAFYRDVFRWETEELSDTAEFRYTVLRNPDGEGWLAGVMDATTVADCLPADVPSHWAVYFGADDADGTLAKAVELGGTILRPAEDTPYGRIGTAADPTGAVFQVVAPNEAMPAKQ